MLNQDAGSVSDSKSRDVPSGADAGTDADRQDQPPVWAFRERAYDAGARWGEANPKRATKLTILACIGAGIGATWWTAAKVAANPTEIWIASAVAGALLGLALTAYWAYVGLVKSYQVGPVSRGVVYTGSAVLALAVVFALLSRDNVSAVTVFSGASVGATFIACSPLLIFGYRTYLRDPDGAGEIVTRAKWLKNMRPPRPPDDVGF